MLEFLGLSKKVIKDFTSVWFFLTEQMIDVLPLQDEELKHKEFLAQEVNAFAAYIRSWELVFVRKMVERM